MNVKDLIAAHQLFGEWHSDDPKNDVTVAFSMLLASIGSVVSMTELDARKARLVEIIDRQTEHLLRVEKTLVAAGVDEVAITEWAILLTRKTTCATLEAVLDSLAKR